MATLLNRGLLEEGSADKDKQVGALPYEMHFLPYGVTSTFNLANASFANYKNDKILVYETHLPFYAPDDFDLTYLMDERARILSGPLTGVYSGLKDYANQSKTFVTFTNTYTSRNSEVAQDANPTVQTPFFRKFGDLTYEITTTMQSVQAYECIGYEIFPTWFIRGAYPDYTLLNSPGAKEELQINTLNHMRDVELPPLFWETVKAVECENPQIYGISQTIGGELNAALKEAYKDPINAKNPKEWLEKATKLKGITLAAAEDILRKKYSIKARKGLPGLDDGQISHILKEFDEQIKRYRFRSLTPETGSVGANSTKKTVFERTQANSGLGGENGRAGCEVIGTELYTTPLFLTFNLWSARNDNENERMEQDNRLKRQLGIIESEVKRVLTNNDPKKMADFDAILARMPKLKEIMDEIKKMRNPDYTFGGAGGKDYGKYISDEKNPLETLKQDMRELTHQENNAEGVAMRQGMLATFAVGVKRPAPKMVYHYNLDKEKDVEIKVIKNKLVCNCTLNVDVFDADRDSRISIDEKRMRLLLAQRVNEMGLTMDKSYGTNGVLYSECEIFERPGGQFALKFKKEYALEGKDQLKNEFDLSLGVPVNVITGNKSATVATIHFKFIPDEENKADETVGNSLGNIVPNQNEPGQAKNDELIIPPSPTSSLSELVPKLTPITTNWSLNFDGTPSIAPSHILGNPEKEKNPFYNGYCEGIVETLRKSGLRARTVSDDQNKIFSINILPPYMLTGQNYQYPYLMATFANGWGVGINGALRLGQGNDLFGVKGLEYNADAKATAGVIVNLGKKGDLLLGPFSNIEERAYSSTMLAQTDLDLNMSYKPTQDLTLNATSTLLVQNSDLIGKPPFLSLSDINLVLRQQVGAALNLFDLMRVENPIPQSVLFLQGGTTGQASNRYGVQMLDGYIGLTLQNDNKTIVVGVKGGINAQGPFWKADAGIGLGNNINLLLGWTGGNYHIQTYGAQKFNASQLTIGLSGSLPNLVGSPNSLSSSPLVAIYGHDAQVGVQEREKPQMEALDNIAKASQAVIDKYKELIAASTAPTVEQRNELNNLRSQQITEISNNSKYILDDKFLQANEKMVKKYGDQVKGYDMELYRTDNDATNNKNSYKNSLSKLDFIAEQNSTKSNQDGQIVFIYDPAATDAEQAGASTRRSKPSKLKTVEKNYKFDMFVSTAIKTIGDANNENTAKRTPLYLDIAKTFEHQGSSGYGDEVNTSLADFLLQRQEAVQKWVGMKANMPESEQKALTTMPEQHIVLVVDGSNLTKNAPATMLLDEGAKKYELTSDYIAGIESKFLDDKNLRRLEAKNNDGKQLIIEKKIIKKRGEETSYLTVRPKNDVEIWKDLCNELHVKVSIYDIGDKKNGDAEDLCKGTGGQYNFQSTNRATWNGLQTCRDGEFANKFDTFFAKSILSMVSNKIQPDNFDYRTFLGLGSGDKAETGLNPDQINGFAYKYRNISYVYGGLGEGGTDCSGIVTMFCDEMAKQIIFHRTLDTDEIMGGFNTQKIKFENEQQVRASVDEFVNSGKKLELTADDGKKYIVLKSNNKKDANIYLDPEYLAIPNSSMSRSGYDKAADIFRQLPNPDMKNYWIVDEIGAEDIPPTGPQYPDTQPKAITIPAQGGKSAHALTVTQTDAIVSCRTYFKAIDSETGAIADYVIESRLRDKAEFGRAVTPQQLKYAVISKITNLNRKLPSASTKQDNPYMLGNSMTKRVEPGSSHWLAIKQKLESKGAIIKKKDGPLLGLSDYTNAKLASPMAFYAPTQNLHATKATGAHMGQEPIQRGEIKNVHEDKDLIKTSALPSIYGVGADSQVYSQTVHSTANPDEVTKTVFFQWTKENKLCRASLVLHFDAGGNAQPAEYYEVIYGGKSASSGILDAEVDVSGRLMASGSPDNYTLSYNHLLYSDQTSDKDHQNQAHTLNDEGTGHLFRFIMDDEFALNYAYGYIKGGFSVDMHDFDRRQNVATDIDFDDCYGSYAYRLKGNGAHVEVASILKATPANMNNALKTAGYFNNLTTNYPLLRLERNELEEETGEK